MDLKELLGGPRINMHKKDLGAVIGSSPDAFNKLMILSLSKDMPGCWRAAWMMDYLAELDPSLPKRHIKHLWQQIPDEHPDGVKRSILRILTRYEIPEDQQGIATDLCLDWLVRESIPVAVKIYCMEILLMITREYPELKEEFSAIIEDQIPHNSVGYKARAAMVIKTMEKL